MLHSPPYHLQTTDALGNITTTTYNSIGQTATETTTTDNGTIHSTYHYNNQGLLDHINEHGNITSYTYDAKKQLTSMTLPNGATTTYTYTHDGQEATVTDAHGGTQTTIYDKKGQVIKTIDAEGNSTQTVYDGNGNTIEQIDALGQSTYTTYDALNRAISQTDKRGNTTTTAYNAANQPLVITLPSGTTRTYTYDNRGREIATKNVACETCVGNKGNAQSTTYDEYNRKTTIKFENGFEEYYTYTAYNDIAMMTNNLGETVERNVYDNYGRLIEQYDAKNNKTTMTYNSNDQIIQTTKPNGTKTTYTYNKYDNMATERDVRGNLTTYTYDNMGNLISTQSVTDRITHQSYDLLGNLISETDALGNTATHEYDLNNRIIKTTDAEGNSTSTTYTPTGEIATSTDARNNTIQYFYDANGNNTVTIDELGERTEYAYDELNRLTIVRNRNGATTSYGYDEYNNQTYTIDAKGNKVTYQYDNMNNLITVTNPDASKERYTYDTKGNVLTEQLNTGKITYQYDVLNNQTQQFYNDKKYAYIYDNMNNLIETHNLDTWTTLTYNDYGDLLTYTGEHNNTVTYTYDKLGNRQSITYPDGQQVSYVYDKNDQLIQVHDNNETTAYEYDKIGRLIETELPNRTRTEYQYDPNGNVVQQLTIELDEYHNGIKTVSDFIYDYDERNLLTNAYEYIEGTEMRKQYTYDAEEQLITSIHKANPDSDDETITEYNYEYDVTGNKIVMKESKDGTIINRQFSFDEANKLTEEAGEYNVAYKYDKAGNVIKKTHKETGLIENFKYDAIGNLIQVTNNKGKTITYDYDAFNNRVQKVETTSLTDANEDLLTSIQTEDGTFNPEYDMEITKQLTKEQLENLKTTIEDFTKTYDQACPMSTTTNDKTDTIITYNYINDIVTEYAEVLQIQNDRQETMYTYTYGVQRITNKKANDTTLYYQYDIKGSVIGQQNKNDSALHFKISYNDYGKPQRDLNNEYGYNAEAHDYNGTQYLRARYYNTDTGRFDKRDSYRGEQNNPISQHRYTYVWNSPNQYHDRSGNRPVLDSTGEDPALDEAVGREHSCTLMYNSGQITYSQYLDCDANSWEYYANNSSQADSSYNDYIEDQRLKAAEARRQEAAEAQAIQDELINAGINLDGFNLDGMSIPEKLRLLRELKRICEDYGLNTEHWDKDAAQAALNEMMPEPELPDVLPGGDPLEAKKRNALELLYTSAKILLGVILSKIPYIGEIVAIIFAFIDYFLLELMNTKEFVTTLIYNIGLIGLTLTVDLVTGGAASGIKALTIIKILLPSELVKIVAELGTLRSVLHPVKYYFGYVDHVNKAISFIDSVISFWVDFFKSVLKVG